MFITFEGVDLCGKTTQAEILVQRLKNSGFDVVFLREPGGTKISELIRNILLDSQNKEMDPITELFLFSASRAQLVREIVIPSLNSGKIVVCDRFYDSTLAYQGYGRGIEIEKIKIVNELASGGLVPDLTFLIDIPVDEIYKRKKEKYGDFDRMERSGIEFYERVRKGYLEIAKISDRFFIIDGQKKIDEISDQIWTIVSEKLKVKVK
ncbi:dTMP kinase [Candidatus Kryptonium thompsonii]|uniref:Thymidylate kinase n=1 Tax=Candidatus Kryptonium thompsonii TaxID=1633631 RepID=A0A0N7MQ19_9BACT|nr:dTMP kinase [Candidatus Kryptonium thompsoni]CUS78998.1 dTMP kinase [Candidatus Kryptonium thompsoni]CUS80611.1 dTMP kinase [Candidatus Kryptonium thompsoni]CUS87263.1 dTMP kinase [Candidatus Kryptonium thompsoni]CUS93102.1 dTMP kinase [Candidatus Kryptonium thompsoni]CUS95183.1 dTMP kinase [Candidatus Kryptonium thompsoni]